MNNAPIIIAGFGRSGTTWLSDIISKVLGGLILFEPFHPCVYKDSRSFCYSSQLSDRDDVLQHLDRCSSQQPNNLWLLRNHLNTPLEENTQSFVSYIWDNTDIIGFKTIRSNHVLSELSASLEGNVIYIYRHPLAVLTSITNRKRFWKEYGWDHHQEYFFERVLIQRNFTIEQLSHFRELKQKAESKEEVILLMWSLSFIISLKEVKKCKGYLVAYEDLYMDPYNITARVMRELNHPTEKMHPSYFFTPSLTTMNTIHSRKELIGTDKAPLHELFWKDKLEPAHVDRYLSLIRSVLLTNQHAHKLATQNDYI